MSSWYEGKQVFRHNRSLCTVYPVAEHYKYRRSEIIF